MIDLDIPGFGAFALRHLVLDYNGTIAVDGILLLGCREALDLLAKHLEIHVITADAHGHAREHLSRLPVSVTVISENSQAEAKLEFIRQLGVESVVAIGNGCNDRKMLEAAAIGIFVVQKEGGAIAALKHADIISTNLLEALDLLRHPRRLLATLQS